MTVPDGISCSAGPGEAVVLRGVPGSGESALLTVLGALDEGTRRQVASVQVTRAGQVSFTLSDGATVNWGGAEESAVKARVLKGLLSQKAKRYDVSAPHAPVTEN